MTQRQRELGRERRWELYRRSVAASMPESDYRTAVLAGISHKLMMLDRMEASRSPLIEKSGGTRTDQSRALTRAATVMPLLLPRAVQLRAAFSCSPLSPVRKNQRAGLLHPCRDAHALHSFRDEVTILIRYLHLVVTRNKANFYVV
jgi:hypothetical protein